MAHFIITSVTGGLDLGYGHDTGIVCRWLFVWVWDGRCLVYGGLMAFVGVGDSGVYEGGSDVEGEVDGIEGMLAVVL